MFPLQIFVCPHYNSGILKFTLPHDGGRLQSNVFRQLCMRLRTFQEVVSGWSLRVIGLVMPACSQSRMNNFYTHRKNFTRHPKNCRKEFCNGMHLQNWRTIPCMHYTLMTVWYGMVCPGLSHVLYCHLKYMYLRFVHKCIIRYVNFM